MIQVVQFIWGMRATEGLNALLKIDLCICIWRIERISSGFEVFIYMYDEIRLEFGVVFCLYRARIKTMHSNDDSNKEGDEEKPIDFTFAAW